MVGISVARKEPRNRKTTSTTSTKASSRVMMTSLMVSTTKVELSYSTCTRIPSGKRVDRSSSAACMAPETCTALAPGAR